MSNELLMTLIEAMPYEDQRLARAAIGSEGFCPHCCIELSGQHGRYPRIGDAWARCELCGLKWAVQTTKPEGEGWLYSSFLVAQTPSGHSLKVRLPRDDTMSAKAGTFRRLHVDKLYRSA